MDRPAHRRERRDGADVRGREVGAEEDRMTRTEGDQIGWPELVRPGLVLEELPRILDICEDVDGVVHEIHRHLGGPKAVRDPGGIGVVTDIRLEGDAAEAERASRSASVAIRSDRTSSRRTQTTMACSTRSTGSSFPGPTSPPTPWSPACRPSAGRWTTSRPTAPSARRRRRGARRRRGSRSGRPRRPCGGARRGGRGR